MKVVKFGGSSLADSDHFAQIIKIIKSDPERKAIVVSAPGTRYKGDVKVTDLLITYANQVLNHEPYQASQIKIINRYQDIADHFQLPKKVMQQIVEVIESLPEKTYPNAEFLVAGFKAQGEYLNAFLLTAILKQLGLPARFMNPEEIGFLVSENAQDATVLTETYQNLAKWQASEQYLVFPGFFGVTKSGHIATFSRGGSDITGSIVARGLNATIYENFTDVDAIYSVDPHMVSEPKSIKVMTYREMRELSYAGFSVFHDEAILPAIEAEIPINVRNTNHPDLPGTMIVPERNFKPTGLVTGVASSKRFAALYLHRYLLNKETGFTLKLLQILYKYHISYEHMPSGIDDLTVIFDKHQFTPELIEQICAEIQATLHPDQLEWINDYAIIMIVGEGMQKSPHTIENIIRPLTDHEIKIHMINQGASKIALMLGTNQSDAEQAVKLVYQHFFDNNRIID